MVELLGKLRLTEGRIAAHRGYAEQLAAEAQERESAAAVAAAAAAVRASGERPSRRSRRLQHCALCLSSSYLCAFCLYGLYLTLQRCKGGEGWWGL